jgi:hypothetical protein
MSFMIGSQEGSEVYEVPAKNVTAWKKHVTKRMPVVRVCTENSAMGIHTNIVCTTNFEKARGDDG